MCLGCGFYKGKMVVDMKSKTEARQARIDAKKDMIRSQNGETSPEAEAEANKS
jgi:hypothetical protein